MAEAYQAQLGVAGGPQLSGADAESFGAAAGRGLEVAGDMINHTVDRVIHEHREHNRDNEAAAAGLALAQATTDVENQTTDARNAAAPGGAGHTAGVVNSIDTIAAQNLGAIKDPHIRQAFAERYAELKNRVGTREYAWEATARVGKLVADTDTAGTLAADSQLSKPDVGSFVQQVHDVATTVGAMNIPDEIKTKVVREQQRKIANGFGTGLVDSNPDAVIEMLGKGTLNQYLEPEDIKTLRSSAEVEIRRREAAARQARSQAEADARERIQGIGKRITAGDYSVTDAEFKSGLADAKLYGLDGPAFDLADWKDKRDVVRETRDWKPNQWHDAINALATKGDKLSTAEGVRLQHLRELAGPAIDRFNSDPAAAASNGGNPPPAVDWEHPDPNAVEKRVSWARAFARASGMQSPPYLTNDELKPLRDRVASPAGQLEIAADLRHTFGVAIGTEVAKQIAPNDRNLQLYVGLEPQAATMVRRGQDALQRNPKLFAGGEGDDVRAREIFNEYAAGIPPELRDPIQNAARFITAQAGDAVHRASLEGDEFEATYRNAIQRAAGQIGIGEKRTGGFVNWNGRRAWLPATMGQTEFQQRLSRAGPAAWKQAGGGEPYYMAPNGKLTPLSDAQLKLLGHYTLESISPGLYQPVGADGRHLVDKSGRNYWTFDVRKLAH